MIPTQTSLSSLIPPPQKPNYDLFIPNKDHQRDKDKETSHILLPFPQSSQNITQNFPKQQHVIENPEEEDEYILSYKQIESSTLQNQSIQEPEVEENEEPWYFIKEPKKKLILSYDVCSELSLKEFFHDCLCHLDTTPNPSRNILITNINQQTFHHFLDSIKAFGDIQNLDLCNFEKEGIVVISYFNFLQSFRASQQLRNIFAKELSQKLVQIDFLIPYNQNSYLDFLLVSNKASFPADFVTYFFSQFDEIMNVIAKNDIYIIRFYDIRTIEKIRAYILKAQINPSGYNQEQLLFFKNVHFFTTDSQNSLFFNHFESLIPSSILNKTYSSAPKINKTKTPLKLTSEAFKITSEPKDDSVMTDVLGKSNQDTKINLNQILDKTDLRTTIMVRNIPNRYTQSNMVDIININYKGLYDFVYLPTDNLNKCNIGYCFINFIQPKHIVSFYKEFNGKRWEVFRSEKVCTLNYGRIQGKIELIKHFKNFNSKNHQSEPLILFNPLSDVPFN